jgi:DNA ligase 1
MTELQKRVLEANGLNLSAWIVELESSDSRLHKEAVIEKALTAATLGSIEAQAFLYNCYLAYNPYLVYGVKKVPETAGLTGKENPWTKFWEVLEQLQKRNLTGNNAKTTLECLSEQFDSTEWNGLARRVIIKDLRCGMSEKTINKIVEGTKWQIPVFTCQLATDSEKHVGKLVGKKRIEQKLDGVRVLAVVTRDSVNLYSRNGKPFENFPHIVEQLDEIKNKFAKLFSKNPTGFVLDGEIIGESFQALMKQAQRKSDVNTDNMFYSVFDIVPMVDFERGFWNAQQHKRLALLEEYRAVFDATESIRIMDGIEVNLDTAEGHDVMRRYAEDAVAAGFEGIMIKDLGAPYECRRSTFWMKWKPVITVDLNIVGFEEGTGRNAGRLGAIICEGVDDDRNIRVNVGSGFSDSDRDGYWSSRDELLGDVVEVMADAVTQNQDGTYSLRFPRFVRFRGFEPGEKL